MSHSVVLDEIKESVPKVETTKLEKINENQPESPERNIANAWMKDEQKKKEEAFY